MALALKHSLAISNFTKQTLRSSVLDIQATSGPGQKDALSAIAMRGRTTYQNRITTNNIYEY